MRVLLRLLSKSTWFGRPNCFQWGTKTKPPPPHPHPPAQWNARTTQKGAPHAVVCGLAPPHAWQGRIRPRIRSTHSSSANANTSARRQAPTHRSCGGAWPKASRSPLMCQPGPSEPPGASVATPKSASSASPAQTSRHDLTIAGREQPRTGSEAGRQRPRGAAAASFQGRREEGGGRRENPAGAPLMRPRLFLERKITAKARAKCAASKSLVLVRKRKRARKRN